MKGNINIPGVSIQEIPILTTEETKDLLFKARAGEQLARDKVVAANMRLVIYVINTYIRQIDDIEDLFQVGCIGLIKAVDNFDVGVGTKFATYAVPRIFSEIQRHTNTYTQVKVPEVVRRKRYKVLLKTEELRELLGREPSYAELGDATGIPSYEIDDIISSAYEAVPLEKPATSEPDCKQTIGETLGSGVSIEDTDTILSYNEALSSLTPYQRELFDECFIKGSTHQAISDKSGVPRTTVTHRLKIIENIIKESIK